MIRATVMLLAMLAVLIVLGFGCWAFATGLLKFGQWLTVVIGALLYSLVIVETPR